MSSQPPPFSNHNLNEHEPNGARFPLGSRLPSPSFKTEKVSGDNQEVTKWVDKYLGVGEWVMDQSIAVAASSGWFERKR